jgi:hypothetical protein
VNDGHKIFGEFLLSGTYVLILDHERGFVSVTQPLEQLEGESAEAVFVGYHNFFDASSQDFVHQP